MRRRRSGRSRMGARLRCSLLFANDGTGLGDLGWKSRRQEGWNGDGGRALESVKEIERRSELDPLNCGT